MCEWERLWVFPSTWDSQVSVLSVLVSARSTVHSLCKIIARVIAGSFRCGRKVSE